MKAVTLGQLLMIKKTNLYYTFLRQEWKCNKKAAPKATVAFAASKKPLLVSGDSKCLAILKYCYILMRRII